MEILDTIRKYKTGMVTKLPIRLQNFANKAMFRTNNVD